MITEPFPKTYSTSNTLYKLNYMIYADRLLQLILNWYMKLMPSNIIIIPIPHNFVSYPLALYRYLTTDVFG